MRLIILLLYFSQIYATTIGIVRINNENQLLVSKIVKSWAPTAIFAFGNNAPFTDVYSVDNVLGRYYSDFMFPYRGKFQKSPMPLQRFYPSIVNDVALASYIGKTPCYDVTIGDIHAFFSSNTCDLRNVMDASTVKWKIVIYQVSDPCQIIPPHGASLVFIGNNEKQYWRSNTTIGSGMCNNPIELHESAFRITTDESRLTFELISLNHDRTVLDKLVI